MSDTASTTYRAPITVATELDFAELFATLADEWRWIALITASVFAAALAYALLAVPLYRTNALIQVEDMDGSFGSALGELSTVISGETPSEGEVEIIRSRSVLGHAISRENLEIVAEPRYFPVLGRAVDRYFPTTGLRDAPPGLERYAWGGERLRVDRLEVPRALEGETLTLRAGADGSYELLAFGRRKAAGKVGEPVSHEGVSIFVSDLHARPGTEFRLRRLHHLEALNELNGSLVVTERGNKTGILELQLDGRSPTSIANTLNAIADTYIRQNVERRSEDAAQTLEFLEQQLPQLKSQLDAAEGELNRYRVTRGTVDLSLETQELLESVGEIEAQIAQLGLEEAELAQRYTAEHPAMRAVAMQRAEMDATRRVLDERIRELPAAERESLRLMRDVRVANELYMHLLNRAQELKVVRAGTVGNVRVIDPAYVPRKPHKPRRRLLAVLGLVVGLAGGVAFVLVREAMNPALRDPTALEQRYDLPVYAIVPHSENEASLNAQVADRGGRGALLLDEHQSDPTVESLRSLRTSLEFLLLECDGRAICIGGPAPAAGKSFVAANLAALFATAGRSVLLVDADMRRGHLHRLFDKPRHPGLADLVVGSADEQTAIVAGLRERLDFLATGTLPPNPAELVTSARFSQLLEAWQRAYDIVILDAPPVLAASESLTLARLSAIALLVVRSDQQTPREIDLALAKLRQAGAAPRGFVFNDLPVERRRHSSYGYAYYRYDPARRGGRTGA